MRCSVIYKGGMRNDIKIEDNLDVFDIIETIKDKYNIENVLYIDFKNVNYYLNVVLLSTLEILKDHTISQRIKRNVARRDNSGEGSMIWILDDKFLDCYYSLAQIKDTDYRFLNI